MQMKFISTCGNQVNNIDISLQPRKLSKSLVTPTCSLYVQILITDRLLASRGSLDMGLTSELQLVKRLSRFISYDPVWYKFSTPVPNSYQRYNHDEHHNWHHPTTCILMTKIRRTYFFSRDHIIVNIITNYLIVRKWSLLTIIRNI